MKIRKSNRFKKSTLILSVFVLVVSLEFAGCVNTAKAGGGGAGQGAATINITSGSAGASQTVEISTSTTYTVILTVGSGGIASDAANPTFTIPDGFTAPTIKVARLDAVIADGEWFVAGAIPGGGQGCTVTLDSSSATLQVVTADVTDLCLSGSTITLIYKGTAPATAMAATNFDIKTTDTTAHPTLVSIASPPTIVVKGTAVFANHATAEVATVNNLAGLAKIGGTDKVLGGFNIAAAGENINVTAIRTNITLGTMVIGQLTNLKIVPDNGADGGVADDGVMQDGELAASLATIAFPVSGDNDFAVTSAVTAGSSNNYFIVGTVASTVSDGDTLAVQAIGAGSVSTGGTSVVTITPTGTSLNTTNTITDTTVPTVAITSSGGFAILPTIPAPSCSAGNLFNTSTGAVCVNNSTTPTITPTSPISPGPSSYNFGTATLRHGSKGEAVKELQRFLNRILNLNLSIDGKLGPRTVLSIKYWQSSNGLKADGVVGPKTKEKMNSLIQ